MSMSIREKQDVIVKLFDLDERKVIRGALEARSNEIQKCERKAKTLGLSGVEERQAREAIVGTDTEPGIITYFQETDDQADAFYDEAVTSAEPVEEDEELEPADVH